MNQLEHLQYLNHLLSWTRYMQQQFDNGLNLRRNGASEQEQWYTRFHYLVREMEEAIKRPYSIQHDDVLTFSRKANELYREIFGLHHTSPTKVKKDRAHHSNRQLDKEAGHSAQHIKSTFTALVDTMIPSTSTWGAVDLKMDEYLMMILDHEISTQVEWNPKTLHLSTPTAVTLDIAATQLMALKNMNNSPNSITHVKQGAFAALSHDDRIEAIRLLENLQVDLNALPSPLRNNGSLVKFIVTYVFQMVKFGYYSEWIAFGSTRFASPENRILETKPFTWELVGYPGVSYGYRALRGFLIDEFDEKVE